MFEFCTVASGEESSPTGRHPSEGAFTTFWIKVAMVTVGNRLFPWWLKVLPSMRISFIVTVLSYAALLTVTHRQRGVRTKNQTAAPLPACCSTMFCSVISLKLASLSLLISICLSRCQYWGRLMFFPAHLVLPLGACLWSDGQHQSRGVSEAPCQPVAHCRREGGEYYPGIANDSLLGGGREDSGGVSFFD